MIPTVYDICIQDVLTIDVQKTLDDAIKKMSDYNLRTIILKNYEDKSYHILTTTHLLEFKISNIDKSAILEDLKIPKVKELDKNINLLSVLNDIDSSDEYMVITENEKLIGIVSYTDIVNNIDPQIMMKKQTLSSLTHQYKAVTTDENASTLQVIHLLKESSRDAVIIVDSDLRPIGIFTTKDFIDIVHNDFDLLKPIKNYMTSPVNTLDDRTTIAKAVKYIKDKHYKRIVVVDENRYLSGIITQKELLKTVYNKWIELIKEEGSKMSRTNEKLLKATSKLKKEVSFDYLTKLYNRNMFDTLLIEQIENFKNYSNYSFSLAMLDIDHFKKINDKHGHLEGDKVLQEIAKILTITTRGSDIVARWGGEEFVILLPNTNIEQATIFSEKLRDSIESFDFKNIGRVTCSIGISQFHSSDTKANFFKRADEALYKAKELGRNRVELEHLN